MSAVILMKAGIEDNDLWVQAAELTKLAIWEFAFFSHLLPIYLKKDKMSWFEDLNTLNTHFKILSTCPPLEYIMIHSVLKTSNSII